MSDNGVPSVSHGRISAGIKPGTLVLRTLAFVRNQLPAWRDDPMRDPVDSEEHLNAQLSKFLNVIARKDFSMVHFHYEERQMRRRRVDLSALPTENILIGSRYHSIYEPFLVMEGKRLPAPSKDRQREYVTGDKKRSGAIQRFKLGLHGGSLEMAVIIGYIQDSNPAKWIETVNNWITEFDGRCDAGNCSWENRDQLHKLMIDQKKLLSECESTHKRINARTNRIHLHHLWIVMQKRV